ncbi:MAG TPA: hypothetical protein VK048_03755 [Atopostipes sp.]|nr:hypothetical protein [Atopostipes sp.]
MLKKLMWNFYRFMYGRYGVDQLYIAGGIFFVAIQILQLFLRIPLVNILLLVFLGWLMFRVFSKNISARQAENRKFMEMTQVVKAKGQKLSRRFQEIQTHRYRKCSSCETTLRLPRKRGKHTVRCPKCNHRFKVRIWL